MKTGLINGLRSKYIIIIQIILMLVWGTQLIDSDAYYVDYAFLLIVIGICTYQNILTGNMFLCKSQGKRRDVMICTFAILFSLMVFLSNYAMLHAPWEFGSFFRPVYQLLLISALLLGGFCAFGNIFTAAASNLKALIWHDCKQSDKPRTLFIISFVILVLTRWVVLHFCVYPGVITPDSIWQMEQLLTNIYSNHHPVFHTMVIKCFVMLGMKLFHDINAAVATYHVFQILFTAMCFSFAVSTMAMMKTPKWIVISTMLFYILMPYHIMYAVTMWKDVMFGCFVLLFMMFIYRYMNDIGNRRFDFIMLVISAFGVCLFRSNGLFAFVIVTIGFFLLCRQSNRKIIMLFLTVIVISFILKHPFLNMMGVRQPATSELLSIPEQQIARVVQEGCELNEWEEEMLSAIIDIDEIPENYLPYISDPIKDMIRDKGNEHLLIEQKSEYIKLYISLGLKYPTIYLRAWIDETRGYWNGGYDYWRWCDFVQENDMGIERTVRNSHIDKMLHGYLWMFTDIQALRLFLSIGLFVWMDLFLMLVALFRKDKTGVFFTLPILAIVASLLITTPVFSEFRYIYAVFCSLPIIAVIVLRPLAGEEKKAIAE